MNCYVHLVSPLFCFQLILVYQCLPTYVNFVSNYINEQCHSLSTTSCEVVMILCLQYSETRTWIIDCFIYWTFVYELCVKSVYNLSNEQVPYPNMYVCMYVCMCVCVYVCLSSSTVPFSWKQANVCAVHKKDDKSCANNYRPISLLCCVEKVFERLIAKRLFSFLLL